MWRAHTRGAVPLLRRPDCLRACDERHPQSRRHLVPRAASPAPQHMRELRGLPRARGTSHGARSPHFPLWEVTVPRQPACSYGAIQFNARSNARWVRRLASGEDRETGPTRATYQLTLRITLLVALQRLAGDIGDGVKALSRSHFSRAARTCSESTISGFAGDGPSDRTQGNVARYFEWGSH